MTTSTYAALLGLQGDLHLGTVTSAALAGNALGDPLQRPVAVYTPPGYDAQGSQRYPVLYCLHGYTGTVGALLGSSAWSANVVQRMDRAIIEGRMPRALLVLVDGFTRLGGSQYVRSVHNGDYETYVTQEVVGYVDAQFRTVAHADGRAVFGKSSGGFGAMHLVMAVPGIFSAFASHSGDSYFRYAALPAFATVQRTLERAGFDRAAFVASFEAKHKPSQSDFVTMEIMGYASAYSPNSNRAFDFDLPFDERSGELQEDVWERWLAYDPAERVAGAAKELGALRLRYLDCGRRDEYNLDIGARVVAKRMRELGLEVRHEEFDDDHRNVGYRYDISLPALAGVLDT